MADLWGRLGLRFPAVDIALRLDDAEQLRSLYAWLRADDELRGSSVELVDAPPGESEMGPVADAVMVAVGGGGAGVVLVRSIGNWLHARGSDLVVTFRSKNGQEIRADVKRLRDPAAAVEIIKALRADDASGS